MTGLILTFLAFVYYFTGSSLLYLSLHDNAWDLGIFNQVLYNSATGHPFAYSFRSFGNYLGDHFSPVLLLAAPLALFKSSLPLLALQAMGVALAVWVLYLLAKGVLKSTHLSAAAAFSFAMNPFTLNILNFDFHPDFAFPLLFFSTIYFLVRASRHPELGSGSRNKFGMTLRRKYLVCAFISVILLQFIREDAALLILPLSIIAYAKFKEKRFAVLSATFTLIYSLGVNLVVMPVIRGGASSPLAEHYPYLGRSIGEIGLNIAQNPLLVLQKFFGAGERTTLLKFLGSAGFLSLLNPAVLALSLPIFAAHFLSVITMRINLQGHYPAQLLAFMYVAVIFGLNFLVSKLQFRVPDGVQKNYERASGLKYLISQSVADFLQKFGGTERLLSIYLVLVTAVSFALFSPFPPSLSADVDRFTVTGRHAIFWQLTKLIPENVPVSAQTNLVPALAFRREVYEFPDLRNALYVVLDERGAVSGQSLAWGFLEKKNSLESLGYKLIEDKDGFKMYKKLPINQDL